MSALRFIFTNTSRRYLSTSAFRSSQSATVGEHGQSANTWKYLSFFVAFPGVALCMVNAYKGEMEHKAHAHRPEFVAYPHLRIRNKAFPWGDGNHSLFHNSHQNPLPEGYEDEE
ncbi:cytochrome c oxidase subunit 6A2, mitochondrial-like [Antedon mediterranea]|uniref:cytochrome c oxidase subunit 6A2, mitochondrial-like n=1 Tax=Antedon mediterranea TaxID=105859 RepID=UPI003AF839BC